MPLVQYLGGATREDNTEIISLGNDENGVPRVLVRGGEPLEVSDDELRRIAGLGQFVVLDEGPSPVDPSTGEPSTGTASVPTWATGTSSTPPAAGADD